jgi:hypothetical protein
MIRFFFVLGRSMFDNIICAFLYENMLLSR